MNFPLAIARNAILTYRRATSSLRLLPDFVIIGSARSGTTSLYNYLIKRPDIAPARQKELHFFDCNYHKGLSWYRAQFPTKIYKYYKEKVYKDHYITGEASPYYLFHPYVPQRMAQLLPQIKLIALLRNPIDRAFSHYRWEVNWGNEHLSFEDAIEQEAMRLQVGAYKLEKGISFNHLHFSYLARSKYAEQLARWFKYFPRERFLIVKSEDMYTDPASVLEDILNFLCISASNADEQVKHFRQCNANMLLDYKNVNAATRQRLIKIFEQPNKYLYDLLGKDLGWE